MNLHLKEIDWRQYLDTPPTENPSEWLQNILAAFKAQYIDYPDIHLALQRYNPENPEWQSMVGKTWNEMTKEERRQDMNRARVYKEQHRK